MTAETILNAAERARRLTRYHRTGEAAALLERAFDLAGDDALRSTLLGELIELRIMTGRHDEARAFVDVLRPLDPDRATVESLWLDYYAGRAVEAAVEAAELAPRVIHWTGYLRIRASLLLGKLFTDAELLEAARVWLVDAFGAARRDADVDQMAACAGALAEVFYRGGAYLPALDLIELDSALLPAGSFHVERLMVYRAHCYRQFGQLDAARSLYEEALQAALLRGRGQSYPLRGLVWCDALELSRAKSPDALRADLRRRLTDLEALDDAHSLGLALAGASWAAGVAGDEEEAKRLRSRAADVFAAADVSSTAWSVQEQARRTATATLAAMGETSPVAACDQWLLEVELADSVALRSEALTRYYGTTLEDGLAWMALHF